MRGLPASPAGDTVRNVVEGGQQSARTHGTLPLDELHEWLGKRGITLRPPLREDLVSGGRSNLTYLIGGADGSQVILRRPPFDLVLATAHDMNREWRFISALRDTAVPVPRALARDEAGELFGVPFYVMSYVEGLVPHDAGRAATLEIPARAALAADLIDVMVALHAVDIDSVGLADIARREGYIDRQLRRWKRQWDQSACTDITAVGQGYDRLAALVPDQVRTGIVHGDLRLGNVICDPAGHIRAVLDWELATLGDPMADLSWLLSSWTEPGDPAARDAGTSASPSVLEGFPSREWLINRYAEGSGADVSKLPFYLAFSIWRGVCISAGVYTRYFSGAMADDGFDFAPMRKSIDVRAGEVLDLLDTL